MEYLASAPDLTVSQQKAYDKETTYEDYVVKALEWHASSHGAGHRGVFTCAMPGEWQGDLLAPLMSAQEALISMQAMEADHAVWDTGGKGRPPAKRAELIDELAVARYRTMQWAKSMKD